MRGRLTRTWLLLGAACVALLYLCLFTGSVSIPAAETWRVLTGGEADRDTFTHIVRGLRIPSTCTAALAGAALSVAGLLLQTTFNNPLAGPSILGVSTGASLGVAIIMLAIPATPAAPATAITGALVGALLVMFVLMCFSTVVRSTMMLLIVGILLSYLTSSVISLLNFYATQEGVHSYVIWGMGNFSSVGPDDILLFSVAIVALLLLTVPLAKPLNALLLGERNAAGVGTDVVMWRNVILLVSGALIAVTTAFCGPIGFLGLAVPHIARLMTGSSNHNVLLPTTILAGAATGLLTLWLTTLPGTRGVIPVNAITPIIGVPVIIYIIVYRRRIAYFN